MGYIVTPKNKHELHLLTWDVSQIYIFEGKNEFSEWCVKDVCMSKEKGMGDISLNRKPLTLGI